MSIKATVVADSVNPDGIRLTTFEVTFPRFILAEVNTHRMLSRNSASSRAIPTKKLLSAVWHNPAGPVEWGRNQAGMQAKVELSGFRAWAARKGFYLARIPAIIVVWFLSKLGLHKQITNRLLEPWMWQTAVLSATSWENFFKLRAHPDAQPEFRALAWAMKRAMKDSLPAELAWGDWHLPYAEGMKGETGAKISAACCARVSYVRQNDRKSVEEDMAMAKRLSDSGHFSPLEHPAQALAESHGNFVGFKQYRKFFEGESGERSHNGV